MVPKFRLYGYVFFDFFKKSTKNDRNLLKKNALSLAGIKYFL